MMNINPHTGYMEARSRSARFTMWASFLLFSAIVMGTSIQVKRSVTYGNIVPASSKYAVACSIITFVATLGAVIAHFLPTVASMFIGTPVEGAIIVVLLAFWTAIVSIVTDAGNGMVSADDPSSEVQNANMYYFSWAGFFTCVLLAAEFGRAVYSVDAAGAIRNQAPRLALWAGLICTQVIIMGSSARVVRKDCKSSYYHTFPTAYCTRAKYGVACGTIGVLFAIGIVVAKVTTFGVSLSIESVTAAVLTILNTCLVAYITSPAGPGTTTGNLYYFSWGSFLLSAFTLFNCFGEYTGLNAPDPTIPSDPSTSNQPNKDGNGDIEVETFDNI